MRTLIFCTAFAPTALTWQRRYRRWVDAVFASELGQQQILLVDDGSPVLPGWHDTDVVTLQSPDQARSVHSHAPVLLLRFRNRLGRNEIYDFPGWYRSFASAAGYASAHGFDKAIHLESDAYVISDRLRRWLRDGDDGWNTLWSPKFNFPEMAIQMIAGRNVQAAAEFTAQPYARLVGVTHETAFPFTRIETGFKGDRYGEDEPAVPADADFATQIPSQREASYYWWLNGASGPAIERQAHAPLRFGRDGNGGDLLEGGWSGKEPAGRWMIHSTSTMMLPPLPPDGDVRAVITVVPHIQPRGLLVQRLALDVNGNSVARFDVTAAALLGFDIPGKILRRDGSDRVLLVHPDAEPPSRYAGGDHRVLALMLVRLSLKLCDKQDGQTLPVPRSFRETVQMFAQLPATGDVASLFSRVDWSGADAGAVAEAMTGQPQALAPPGSEDGEGVGPATAAALFGAPGFRSFIAWRLLRSFPEKRRLLFVHLPRSAGTDFALAMRQRFPHAGDELEDAAFLPADRFATRLRDFARAIADADTVFMGGHMPLAGLVAGGLVRPQDRLVTILRHPHEVWLSFANAVVQRFLADPGLAEPDTGAWAKMLDLKREDVAAMDPRALALAVAGRPDLHPARPICSLLGDGTARGTLGLLGEVPVEITTLGKYPAWIKREWGIVHQARVNAAPKLIGWADLPAAQQESIAASCRADALVYGAVNACLEASGAMSVSGPELARQAPRGILQARL